MTFSANAGDDASKRVGCRMRSEHRAPVCTRTADHRPGLRSCGVRVPGAAPMPNCFVLKRAHKHEDMVRGFKGLRAPSWLLAGNS